MEAGRSVNISSFSPSQRTLLEKGKVRTVEDLVLSSIQDISRRCKISPLEAQGLVDALCCGQALSKFDQLDANAVEDEVFTSGDDLLDEALGGGFRTGMLWDVSGESAAGKTQLGLQLSLCVQLPPESGGLSGSACYLTTSSTLPTNRLLEICKNHPLLEQSNCTLDSVYTLSVPTISILLHVLSVILPNFVMEKVSTRPVKLVLIDSLAELFHMSEKTTTSTLVERSQYIAHVATLLHRLASENRIAIVVLNEVMDVVQRLTPQLALGHETHVVYSEQSRWFNSANSLPEENLREASLGLTWANQINNRIILTRTRRRRYLTDSEVQHADKYFKNDKNIRSAREIDKASEREASLIRRISIVFSSCTRPRSLDYIITIKGFSCLPILETLGEVYRTPDPVADANLPSSSILPINEEVDWDSLISPEDSYEGVDWGALEESLTGAS